MLDWLLRVIDGPDCGIEGIREWKTYREHSEFKEIQAYVRKEQGVIRSYRRALQQSFGQAKIDPKVMTEEFSEGIFQKCLKDYVRQFLGWLT